MTLTPDIAALIEAKKKHLGKVVDTASHRVLQTWVEAWDDMDADLARLDLTGSQKQREARLRLARSRASEQILQLATETASLVNDAALDLIEQAIVDQPELIASQLPPQMGAGSLLRPPGEELAAITARVQEQVTVRAYWLSVASTESMRRALVLGVAAGDNPRETARRMVANAEDAFNGGLARAMVIARTETLDAYRAAAQASQDANSDVLAGWRWMASLSERTCPSCIAQHGTFYPLDEPGPLDHHQGRCYRAPVTKPWQELGYDVDEPNAPVETGADWFARQPEHVQRDILGPSRYEAWKAGAYPPDAWSVRRSADGWRDSFHVGPLPPFFAITQAAPSVPPELIQRARDAYAAQRSDALGS